MQLPPNHPRRRRPRTLRGPPLTTPGSQLKRARLKGPWRSRVIQSNQSHRPPPVGNRQLWRPGWQTRMKRRSKDPLLLQLQWPVNQPRNPSLNSQLAPPMNRRKSHKRGNLIAVKTMCHPVALRCPLEGPLSRLTISFQATPNHKIQSRRLV